MKKICYTIIPVLFFIIFSCAEDDSSIELEKDVITSDAGIELYSLKQSSSLKLRKTILKSKEFKYLGITDVSNFRIENDQQADSYQYIFATGFDKEGRTYSIAFELTDKLDLSSSQIDFSLIYPSHVASTHICQGVGCNQCQFRYTFTKFRPIISGCKCMSDTQPEGECNHTELQ